ncbi:sister chromatid cohesion and DNA repair protein [Phaeosphaeriaceae sp. PMI808]|nr:sister chromatid cohesion and DNA repair protein [Phaeosphaeriaceae sp. PMI808]
MAPRSRRSAAAAPEIVEEEEQEQEQEQGQEQEQEQRDQDDLKKLRFKQPLVGRPGKQISVGELLTRLEKLLNEVRTIDQEEAHRESLMPVAQELVHQSLLQHKDNGVRARAVCCIVDMLRLFAPDAPYPASKLKDVFSVIILKMLPLLADPNHPYNSEHMYILRSLAEWKSILLINEIPGSDQLTSALFTTCFDVLSGPSKSDNGDELSKNVEHHMTEVLSTVIDEASAVAHDVVDVIVAQFLWADPITLGGSAKSRKGAQIDVKQSTLRRKAAPPAYNMARNVCNAFPEKMARLIGNYFSSVIVDFTNLGASFRRNRATSEDPDDDAPRGPSDDDINEASKAHRLLRELWKCCPGVLKDIIPRLQDELATENVQLRQLATDTFGDMISGIGAAGPPPLPELDPAAYPSQSLTRSESERPFDFLTTPASINSFPTQHPLAYHAFLQRRNDKSPIIRASWTTGIGRILMTSAGGIGLDLEEEQKLLKMFADCLIDSDDKVRLAAVKAIEHFEFNDIVRKLGSNGGMSEPGSILANLADRVKDKKSIIHSESMKLLGKIWGVAAGAIAEGDENIKNLLDPIPSRILEACYVNDLEINVQVDLALYESLLPLSYPPIKPRPATGVSSQVVKDSQTTGDQGYTESDLDKIRAERQLVLVKNLEDKAKKVFFAKQGNQGSGANYMEHFLKFCEEYNGGVMDRDEKETKKKLQGLIGYYARTLPDSTRVADDLWKFAKAHDRRAYTLLRFCMDPASDYRRVFRSIKEFRKRIEDGPGASVLETLKPLIYRVSLLCYNKSHVSAIIEFTRTDHKGLGATAHELLKEISTKHPKVFSTHSQPPGAVDDLKACAAFAKKFPTDIPMNAKDGRKLVQGFLNFALYGTPAQASKHAITIITNSDDKKEMHLKEILAKSMKNFEYGGDHWLTKLAALSQLVLLAPSECEEDMDTIVEIAIRQVLQNVHSVTVESEAEWMDTPDEDIQGRAWAIKILVNRLRSIPGESSFNDAVEDTYALLNRLVKDGGEGSDDNSTPAAHKTRQRLIAANSLLKLSCNKRLDSFLTPANFVQLALVTHDPCAQVRKCFSEKLMKYLGQGRLPPRFYTILFFLAHEPDKNIKNSTMTWIRSRRAAFAARKETTLENIFARLLSLLAHHPDFDKEDEVLKLMSEYILYYLKCVATKDNLSLIFHVAQRVKGVADGIAPSRQADENLYVLSDLAQALIRAWEEQNGWTMQSWPGPMKLPSGVFRRLESHERAQEIAKKTWITEDLMDELDPLVRKAIRSKKRKATDESEKPRKKVKGDKPIREKKVKSERQARTPKKKRRIENGEEESGPEGHIGPSSSGPRRKSGRHSTAHKSYVELSSDEEEHVGASAELGNLESSDEGSEKSSPVPEEDVDMADQDEEVRSAPGDEGQLSEQSYAKTSPEPKPSTKALRHRLVKKANGVDITGASPKRKVAEPVEDLVPEKTAKSTAKKKAERDTAAPSSNDIINGARSVRRSGRTRS